MPLNKKTYYHFHDDSNKNSFCPAKWQEITFMPAQGLANACHRTQRSTLDDIPNQQIDSLMGIRNPLCNHCWVVEDAGKESSRQGYIKAWDGTFELKTLRVNIGNLCNMGCSYCNHRISSMWATDIIKNGEYDIKFDKDVYSGFNFSNMPDVELLLDFIKTHKPAEQIAILGGEPFINSLLLTVIKSLDCSNLDIRIPTNMCFANRRIATEVTRIKCKNLYICPSVDVANREVQEFIREGFKWKVFHSNLRWFIEHSLAKIVFLSVITAHNVWWIDKTYRYISNYVNLNPNRFSWDLDACVQPRNQSFEILTPAEKEKSFELIEKIIQTNDDIGYHSKLKMIQGFIIGTQFNEELRNDQKNFFRQFAFRRNLNIPKELYFLLND